PRATGGLPAGATPRAARPAGHPGRPRAKHPPGGAGLWRLPSLRATHLRERALVLGARSGREAIMPERGLVLNVECQAQVGVGPAYRARAGGRGPRIGADIEHLVELAQRAEHLAPLGQPRSHAGLPKPRLCTRETAEE